MNPILANEAELYFERGGPSYRITHRIVQNWQLGKSIRPRIIAFLLVTWVPLLIFALLEGRALGPVPRESLLLDFGTYARFFLGVPLLVIAEILIGPRLRAAGLQLIQGGYVKPEDFPALDKAIATVVKWRESGWAEFILLGLALVGAWFFTTETITGGTTESWRSVNMNSGFLAGKSITGIWYHLVAVPLIQFFWYRWLYRVFIWAKFLWTVSRLNLNLIPTHADQAGGLGFLGTAHTSFGVLAFGLTSILSAEVAFQLVYENAQIDNFKVEYFVVLITTQVLFLGPLLLFAPIMARTRLAWLREYSLLTARYNRAFHTKWIEGKSTSDEQLLGSADIQSLADLGSSFEYIGRMRVVPFGTRVIIQLAVVTSLPCLPLLLIVFPVNKIISLLAGAVY